MFSNYRHCEIIRPDVRHRLIVALLILQRIYSNSENHQNSIFLFLVKWQSFVIYFLFFTLFHRVRCWFHQRDHNIWCVIGRNEYVFIFHLTVLCETKESIHGLLGESFYKLMNQITWSNPEKYGKITLAWLCNTKCPGNDGIAKISLKSRTVWLPSCRIHCLSFTPNKIAAKYTPSISCAIVSRKKVKHKLFERGSIIRISQ